MKQERIIWIDFVRVTCTLYIVGRVHLPDYVSFEYSYNHTYAVSIISVLAMFVFISGFFAGGSEVSSVKDVIHFIEKKLVRLYPLFVLASICLVLCGVNRKKSLIKTFLGLGVLVPESPLTVWFASMLILFYLITPFILLTKCKKNKLFFLIIVELCFVLLNKTIKSDERLFLYWIFYTEGFICRQEKWHMLLNKNIALKMAPLILITIYILISYYIHNDSIWMMFVLINLFIISICSIMQLFFGNICSSWLIEKISYASFCAYLFHRPIFYIWTIILGRFNVLQAYLICVPSVIILSWVIQYVYDKIIRYLGVLIEYNKVYKKAKK